MYGGYMQPEPVPWLCYPRHLPNGCRGVGDLQGEPSGNVLYGLTRRTKLANQVPDETDVNTKTVTNQEKACCG